MLDSEKNHSNGVMPEEMTPSQEVAVLARINQVAKKINSTLELSQIIKIIITELPNFLNADKCSVFLYEQETEELVMAAHNHYDPGKEMDIRISIHGNQPICHAIRRGESILVNDFEKEFGVSSRSKYKSKSAMITLLKSGEKVLGIINISDKKDGSEFDDFDFSIAQNVNEHLATAISNANLFSQTRRLSITDGLTELYTHRYFQETLDREITRSMRYQLPLSLMMIDIDFFKRVNDTHGHQAGDCVLKALSLLIRKLLRRSDYACRYGGEEFAVILTETDIKKAGISAERVRSAVEKMVIPFGDLQIKITISIGLSTFEPGMRKQKMIELADLGLYEAKREGRNQVVVTDLET